MTANNEEGKSASGELVSVRCVHPDDCDKLSDLAVQLGYPSTAGDVRRRLAAMQDASEYGIFVAELPVGQVAGWICAYVFRSLEMDPFAEINGLIVDDSFRSRRIGKFLLRAAEVWAQGVGCSAIAVNSNILRDRAHHFYTRSGYELVKTQKVFRKFLT